MAELRAEIRRGYLGVLWWIIEPVLYMSVFFVLFAAGLRKGGIDAVPFFLTGLVPWKWFATSVGKSGNILTSNANILKQVKLPIYIFPSVTIFINTFKFLIVFSILLLFLAFSTDLSCAFWWTLPMILLVQLLIISALVFWVAAVVPIIPDLQYVVPNMLMLLFFLSGIFFDISAMNEPVRTLLMLNPMATLVAAYRAVLVNGTSPNFLQLAILFVVAVGLLFTASIFLSRYSHNYPKIIR
ncbi:MAG: ABC transporter permease [Desulfobulbaceae bacterium]|nr:ABC transporter permease [Desulfobulbaceae bacterium]